MHRRPVLLGNDGGEVDHPEPGSAIGSALWHLAGHPEDRRRLAPDTDHLTTAVEEFLRAYAPVTMARPVAQDCELGGQSLHEGDWLLLPFPSAHRDPEVLPAPTR